MTKAEELKILEQVRNLIAPTFYVKTAFAGVLEYAERNIADDAAYNPVEELDHAYKDSLRRDAEMGNKLICLEHERDALQKNLNDAEDRISVLVHDRESWEQNAHDAGEMYCDLEKECAELEKQMVLKDAEIIHLKAEIYDLRKELGK